MFNLWSKMVFHIHKFKYFNYVKFPDTWEFDRPYHKYKQCTVCGDFYQFSVHCLGLRPAEYVGHWCKIKGKPKFKVVKGKLFVMVL